VGSIVLVISQNESPDWQSILIIGLLIFSISLIWWKMAKRWWDVQHVTFLRMKHLEEELHYYQTRYISHKDGKCDLQADGVTLSQPQIDELNISGNKNFHLEGVQSWLWLLPWIVFLSWAALAFSRWNDQTAFYSTQCLKQSIICTLLIASPLLIIVVNWICIRIKKDNCERSEIVAARNKKSGIRHNIACRIFDKLKGFFCH
jgi:hypothetical protein